MSSLLTTIQKLAAAGEYRISEHAQDELDADGIFQSDMIESLGLAVIVEEDTAWHKGPCILLLQHDRETGPVHTLWGVGKDTAGPAVMITAYRPDAARWAADFKTRIPR